MRPPPAPPTAKQSDAVTHDTPFRTLSAGLGLVTIDHDGEAPAEEATLTMTDATRPTDTSRHTHARARRFDVTTRV